MSKKIKLNPFDKLDASVSDETVTSVVHHIGEAAKHLRDMWRVITPTEQAIILDTVKDVGSKLVMGAVTAGMTGDMGDVVSKIVKTLSQSKKLTRIGTELMKVLGDA